MEESKLKKLVYIILSVVAGIAGAVAAFFILILFFFATGLFGWSDGGEKDFLKRLEFTTNLTLVVSIIIALFIGIFVIVKMNKPNQQKNK
jgi:FtsH-binding integral membrane protein